MAPGRRPFSTSSRADSSGSGAGSLSGQEVTGARPHVLSQLGMARSFQINNFFPTLTTMENMQLAVQSPLKKGTSSWSRFAGSDGLREKTLDVLEAIGLGNTGAELAMNLSYGDQRKLEIGLARGPNPSF